MSENRGVSVGILATLAVITITAAAAVFVYRSGSHGKDEREEGAESDVRGRKNHSKPNAPKPAIEVEDVDDGDDADDEEESDEDRIKRQNDLIKAYDKACALAKEYFSKQKLSEAIEQYSIAIELASEVSSAGKDILTLYNNRSAMFEKTDKYEEALSDIAVVLSINPKHEKARTRKARVLESSGDLKGAFCELITIMCFARAKGEEPKDTDKIEQLNRKVSSLEAAELLTQIRRSRTRDLPTIAYCRNFFETFPSLHEERARFEKIKSDRADLVAQVERAKNPRGQWPSWDKSLQWKLKTALELAWFDIVQNNFQLAFTELSAFAVDEKVGLDTLLENATVTPVTATATATATAETTEAKDELSKAKTEKEAESTGLDTTKATSSVVELAASSPANAASILFDVLGAAAHLRCNFADATANYKKALALNPTNFEAALKLASVYLELGETSTAQQLYDATVKGCETGDFSDLSSAILQSTNDGLSAPDSDSPSSSVAAAPSPSPSPVPSPLNPNQEQAAWALLHRSVLWVTRNTDACFRTHAVDLALADVEKSLKLTENSLDDVSGRSSRLIAHIKIIQILGQIKQQCGELPNEEDQKRCTESIREAKLLFPSNPMVKLMEADLISSEGDIQKGLDLCDEVIRLNEGCPDAIPYVIKANISSNLFFSYMQNLYMGDQSFADRAQKQIKIVEDLYEKSMELEPNCIEALTQLANLKTMLGDFDTAVSLLEKATSSARNSEEALEILLLRNMSSATAEGNKIVMEALRG